MIAGYFGNKSRILVSLGVLMTKRFFFLAVKVSFRVHALEGIIIK